jgi:hypothetical protein
MTATDTRMAAWLPNAYWGGWLYWTSYRFLRGELENYQERIASWQWPKILIFGTFYGFGTLSCPSVLQEQQGFRPYLAGLVFDQSKRAQPATRVVVSPATIGIASSAGEFLVRKSIAVLPAINWLTSCVTHCSTVFSSGPNEESAHLVSAHPGGLDFIRNSQCAPRRSAS